MCGLAGFISLNARPSSNYKQKREFVTQALYLSAMRGMDGTGIAIVEDPTKPAEVYKKAFASYDFLQLKKVDRYLSDIDRAKAVILHTRATTRGNNSDRNCHPFQFGNITLAHNGYISNPKQIAPGLDYDVDSAHAAAAFSTKPAIEVLPDVMGAYCFVWHDAASRTINITRNDDRPLHYAYIPEWNGIAFMSEHVMLAMLLARVEAKIKDKYWYPTKHTVLSFNLEGEELKETIVPFAQRETRVRGSPTGATTALGTRPNKVTLETLGIKPGSLRAFGMNRDKISKQFKEGCAVPETKKQARRADARLRLWQLESGLEGAVTPVAWMPYLLSPDLGFMIGKMEGWDNTKPLVLVHDVDKDQYADIRKDETAFVVSYDVWHMENSPVILAALDETVYPDKENDKEESNVIQMVMGPHNELITTTEFKKLTNRGCSLCTGNVNPDFADSMIWGGEYGRDPICHECTSNYSETGTNGPKH